MGDFSFQTVLTSEMRSALCDLTDFWTRFSALASFLLERIEQVTTQDNSVS